MIKDNTHLVLKLEDVNLYLTQEQQGELGTILEKIDEMRILEGKKRNEYIVINTDEPYAHIVKSVMEEYIRKGYEIED